MWPCIDIDHILAYALFDALNSRLLAFLTRFIVLGERQKSANPLNQVGDVEALLLYPVRLRVV